MLSSRSFLLLTLLLLASCAPLSDILDQSQSNLAIGKPHIKKQNHSPLLPSSNEAVTFSVHAMDSLGIARVILEVFEYKLAANGLGLPSKYKREDGLWGQVKDWNFTQLPKEQLLKFTYPTGFPDASNIIYQFTIWNSKGKKTYQRIQFDAGASPWPEDKILLYGDENSDLSKTINICFIADVDFQNDWQHFTKQLEALIYDGYFNNNMIENHKGKWKFFLSKRSLDGQTLYADYLNQDLYPAYLTSGQIEGIDVFGLIHQTEYSDASYLKSNLSFLGFNLFTSESFNFGTAVHETGHAVFNLYDEYNGCACTRGQGGSNVFQSQEDCQNFLIENGLKIYECPTLENYKGEIFYVGEENIYFESLDSCTDYSNRNNLNQDCIRYRKADGTLLFRAEGALCIMQDDGNQVVNDFQQVCSKVISSYYDNLADGPTIDIASSFDNMYQYIPVVVSEFNQDKSNMNFTLNSIRYGIPSKSAFGNAYAGFQFQDAEGNKLSGLNINNPSQINLHQDDEVHSVQLNGAATTIKIPVLDKMAKISCSMLQKDKSQRDANPDPVFEVGDKLFELRKAFKQKKNN